jgi:RNA polymerase sigma-70 factor (ECF subfamily)
MHTRPVQRDRVLALVASQVHVRFALDASTFTERLLELGRAASSDRTPDEHARRLSLDDLYLASACAQGEEGAWEECLARHGDFVRGFARRFLREPAASDVADQVIADLWERKKMARYEGRSTLRTWLGAIVAHAALNAVKADRRWLPLEGEGPGPRRLERSGSPPDVGATEDRSLLEGLVGEAMKGLPAEDKLLILLHYEQDLTLDEMAIAVGGSKAGLSRKLKRAREQLRASIDALAQSRTGVSAETLRSGIDLRRLQLDLGTILGGAVAERKHDGTV